MSFAHHHAIMPAAFALAFKQGVIGGGTLALLAIYCDVCDRETVTARLSRAEAMRATGLKRSAYHEARAELLASGCIEEALVDGDEVVRIHTIETRMRDVKGAGKTRHRPENRSKVTGKPDTPRPENRSRTTGKPVSDDRKTGSRAYKEIQDLQDLQDDLVGQADVETEAQPALELVSSEPSLVEQLLADDPPGKRKQAPASTLERLAARPNAIRAAKFVRWYGAERCKALGQTTPRSLNPYTSVGTAAGVKRVRAVLRLFDEEVEGEGWGQYEKDLVTAARGLLGDSFALSGPWVEVEDHLVRNLKQFERRLSQGKRLAETGAHPSDNRRQQRESCMGDWPEPPPLTDEQRATRQRLLDSLPVRQGWGKTA